MSTEFTVSIPGSNVVTVTVAKSSSAIEAYLRAVRPSSTTAIVGLDVEWKTNGKVSVLQLCRETKCLIVQLMHLDRIPQALKDFLADPSITFVGVGIENDVAKLESDYGLNCRNAEELGPLTGTAGSASASLVDLADKVLGLKIVKSSAARVSDWEVANLTNDQVGYAATDARLGYLIGAKLLGGN